MGSGSEAVIFPNHEILGVIFGCNYFSYRLITLCYPLKCVFACILQFVFIYRHIPLLLTWYICRVKRGGMEPLERLIQYLLN